MRIKRQILIDEITESCRLMPTYVQSIIMISSMGICYLTIPAIPYSLPYAIIFIQIIFIILLIQKNIVYRKISELNEARKRKVIWVHTDKDDKDLTKKRIINIVLLGLTGLMYINLNSTALLVINNLFCLLFSLKIVLFVPLLSIRIIDQDGSTFQIIDKRNQENIQIATYKINKIFFKDKTIGIKTDEETIEMKMIFRSKLEKKRVLNFLTSLDEIKDKIQ